MSCDAIRSLLEDPAAMLPPDGEAHLLECRACQELRLSFARLDALLLSEPAPPAPPELAARVLLAVAARRRHDAAWARRQLLLLVAAAALVAGLGLLTGWAPVDTLTSGLRAEGGRLTGELLGFAQALLARGQHVAGSASALPSPPLLLLVLLAPALVLLNHRLCRAAEGRAS